LALALISGNFAAGIQLGLWLIWNVKRINCLRSATGNKSDRSQELSGGFEARLKALHAPSRDTLDSRKPRLARRPSSAFENDLWFRALMLRPRKFSGGPLLFDAMLFAAMARGPLSALPRDGGDVRGGSFDAFYLVAALPR